MKRFDGKVRLFCISNIMVSFIGTGFLGINGYTESIEGPVLSAHEISLASSDTEPASQYGEGEDNIYALITEGIKAMIEQQEDALEQDEKEEEKEESTKKSEVTKKDVKTGNTKKTTTKKTTTKKTSTKKTSTKKSSSKSTTYTYNGTATGNAIVSYAKKFLGLRYRGGTPSLKSGADCSGFTMLIYKAFGISLPRSVSGQLGKGKTVSKSNLQKGDLVFFRPKGCSSCGISHVSIYIGGGQVIHETRPGRGVAITKIDGLSNIVFAKAKRVINSSTAKVAEKKIQEQNNSSKTDTTNTQDNKNEGNVNNNVAATATPTPTTAPKVVATPTPTPVPKKEEPKVEVKVENVDNKEESSSNGQ